MVLLEQLSNWNSSIPAVMRISTLVLFHEPLNDVLNGNFSQQIIGLGVRKSRFWFCCVKFGQVKPLCAAFCLHGDCNHSFYPPYFTTVSRVK